jgi:anti-sigma factor RsiW/predicted negative regulator of RcsB-dependent stress response
MMDMGHIDDVLIEFLYGELAEMQAREVEAHLATCERCAGEVARMREVRQAMTRLPQLAPREGVTANILRRAQELAPERRRSLFGAWLLRPSLAGAFLFILVLGIGLYVVRTGSDDEAPRDSLPISRFSADPGTATPAATPAAPALAPMSPAAAPAAGSRMAEKPVFEREDRAPPPLPQAKPRIVARVARPAEESLFPDKTKTQTVDQDPAGKGLARAKKKAPKGEARSLQEAFGGGVRADAETQKAAPRPNDDLRDLRIVAKASRPATMAAEPPAPGAAQPAAPPAQAYLPAMRAQAQAESQALAQEQVQSTRKESVARGAAPVDETSAMVVDSRTLLAQARRDMEEGRNAEAAQKLKNAATAGGREAAQALMALAELQLREGQVGQAIETLERLLRTNPGYATARAYELLAAAYDRRGDSERAQLTRAVARKRFAPAQGQAPAKATSKPAF